MTKPADDLAAFTADLELKKALHEGVKKFHRTVAICSGPIPLGPKSSIMAGHLIEVAAVTTTDREALAAVIKATLIDLRARCEAAGSPEERQGIDEREHDDVAAALKAAGFLA